MEQFYITLINGEVIRPAHDIHFLCLNNDPGYSSSCCDTLTDFVQVMQYDDRKMMALSKKYQDRSGKHIFRIIPKENILSYSAVEKPTINLIKHT